ncbi:MAG: hypothetical protein HRT45_05320 [Bdellovibrionales bacterium]|nr:hypothetical protein [Bdellovibrionales bacterium]
MSKSLKNYIWILAAVAFVAIAWSLLSSDSDQAKKRSQASKEHKYENQKKSSAEASDVVVKDSTTESKDLASNATKKERMPQAIEDNEAYMSWLNEKAMSPFKVMQTPEGSRAVLGPNIPLSDLSRKAAFDLASEFASAYGLPEGALVQEGKNSKGTSLTQPFQFEQQSHGYQVYDSYVRLQVKKEDQSVYMIVNQLQKVPEDFNVTIKYNLAEATNIARAPYQEQGVFRVVPMVNEPIIFAKTDGEFDLAWHLVTQISKAESFTLLVSASTGEILNSYPNHSHDSHGSLERGHSHDH